MSNHQLETNSMFLAIYYPKGQKANTHTIQSCGGWLSPSLDLDNGQLLHTWQFRSGPLFEEKKATIQIGGTNKEQALGMSAKSWTSVSRLEKFDGSGD